MELLLPLHLITLSYLLFVQSHANRWKGVRCGTYPVDEDGIWKINGRNVRSLKILTSNGSLDLSLLRSEAVLLKINVTII